MFDFQRDDHTNHYSLNAQNIRKVATVLMNRKLITVSIQSAHFSGVFLALQNKISGGMMEHGLLNGKWSQERLTFMFLVVVSGLLFYFIFCLKI